VPFWKREEPLHERLAREGGLPFPSGERPPHDTRPRWGEAGIHGIHRFREWDAVVRVEEAEIDAEEVRFVALPDGTLVVEDEVEGDPSPFAEAIERELGRSYRAHAVRGEQGWAVAAEAIEIVELEEDVEGDEIELSISGGERTLLVDRAPAFGRLRELERLGEARGDDFVVSAARVDGKLWDVRVLPL
jgi:hypothetical protein